VTERTSSAFRIVPRTGVIYVMTEAAVLGYKTGDVKWCNLGQGMPETGPLPGGPPRKSAVAIDPADQEYAPVPGVWELREAVASLYNARYRRGLKSQYTAENVAIAGGGRAALTRVAASLGQVNLGHFLPDYTAYEELLDIFRSFTSIPILLEPESAYEFRPEALRKEIEGRGLGALLLSNPSNPTGKVISGNELAEWVETARKLDCAMIFDEFYSHYVWSGDGSPVSAAAFVKDVDKDPVLLLDGLTKNWRYPGWRVSWIVAPRPVIESVSSAGSFLDGGGSRPLQRAAAEFVTLKSAEAEAASLQAAFRAKRELMRTELEKMGVVLDGPGDGTFYCWGSVAALPAPLNTGMGFFRAALEKKVIVVPGEFFDVNPGKRRAGRSSRFRSHVRFSFGPAEASVREGLKRLAALSPSAS
jgi:aspartate/methionine/tyrosine aminotransferase